jgi:hypothetical protein
MTVQSGLNAYHKAGLLKFGMGSIKPELINLMFDNFDNIFGTGHDVQLELRSKGDLPEILITPDVTLLTMSGELAILNPLNTQFDAIQMQSKLTMELEPALNPLDMSITAKLRNLTLNVVSVKALYKQDKISVERVDQAINAFIENLKKSANEQMEKKGLKLPIPEFFQLDKYTKNRGFDARDGYYVVKADAKIEYEDDETPNGSKFANTFFLQ